MNNVALQIYVPVETDVALDNLDFIFSREGRGYNQVSCVYRDNCGVHHVVILIQQAQSTTVAWSIEIQGVILKTDFWDSDRGFVRSETAK